MTEPPNPSPDPFAQLWQSAPAPDTRQLMLDLQRLQRVHQRQNRVLIVILCATGLLLVFGAVALRSFSLGVMTGLWVAFVAGIIWYQRARCRAADALDLDTVSLLKRMIERAKRGLIQARRLYAGVPVAAVAGALVTRMVLPSIPLSGHAIHPWLTQIYTVASVIMLVVMVGAGLVLARARRSQLRELAEKLTAFEDNM